MVTDCQRRVRDRRSRIRRLQGAVHELRRRQSRLRVVHGQDDDRPSADPVTVTAGATTGGDQPRARGRRHDLGRGHRRDRSRSPAPASGPSTRRTRTSSTRRRNRRRRQLRAPAALAQARTRSTSTGAVHRASRRRVLRRRRGLRRSRPRRRQRTGRDHLDRRGAADAGGPPPSVTVDSGPTGSITERRPVFAFTPPARDTVECSISAAALRRTGRAPTSRLTSRRRISPMATTPSVVKVTNIAGYRYGCPLVHGDDAGRPAGRPAASDADHRRTRRRPTRHPWIRA